MVVNEMKQKEEQALFEALSTNGGLWALEQVELLKRLRREPNHHLALVRPHSFF